MNWSCIDLTPNKSVLVERIRQQTSVIHPMLIQCWPSVKTNQCRVNVSRLLGQAWCKTKHTDVALVFINTFLDHCENIPARRRLDERDVQRDRFQKLLHFRRASRRFSRHCHNLTLQQRKRLTFRVCVWTVTRQSRATRRVPNRARVRVGVFIFL